MNSTEKELLKLALREINTGLPILDQLKNLGARRAEFKAGTTDLIAKYSESAVSSEAMNLLKEEEDNGRGR